MCTDCSVFKENDEVIDPIDEEGEGEDGDGNEDVDVDAQGSQEGEDGGTGGDEGN